MDITYPYFVKFEYEHSGISIIKFDAFSDNTAVARLLQYSSDAHGPDLLYNGNLKL